ncbi:MAG: D-alanine--D-alanine ligase [Ignavibacteriales bacterium]|nr:D-alanine--D-alanine ligase [Ignavibacteriales bacterium]
MKKKLRIGVLFGGRSAEHEVSLVSAASVMQALDKKKYDVVPIGITPEGRWLSSAEALWLLKEKSPLSDVPEHVVLPDPAKQGLVPISGGRADVLPVDVIFPVLHGTCGEDGSMQGLLELADIPYVGAAVLGSALGMDKIVQKQVLRDAGIPVVPFVSYSSHSAAEKGKKLPGEIEKAVGYPCFVKPANTGSSIGISKVHGRKELVPAVELALRYDRKILIECGIRDAREIECAVLGNDDPRASVLGEIIPSNEFYDYDAKYVDGKTAAIIPAQMAAALSNKIRTMALQAYRVLDCAGMARVDFFLQKNTNKIFLNEINTIPGFTSISMYPKLWEASGLSYPHLLDELIGLARQRHNEHKQRSTHYDPKKEWYKG